MEAGLESQGALKVAWQQLVATDRHVWERKGVSADGGGDVRRGMEVMGEQNAKMLRGEKAVDIIFAGSQKRKAQSVAEVSLVFDKTFQMTLLPNNYY